MIHLIVQYYQVKYKNHPLDLIKKRQEEINYCFHNKADLSTF